MQSIIIFWSDGDEPLELYTWNFVWRYIINMPINSVSNVFLHFNKYYHGNGVTFRLEKTN